MEVVERIGPRPAPGQQRVLAASEVGVVGGVALGAAQFACLETDVVAEGLACGQAGDDRIQHGTLGPQRASAAAELRDGGSAEEFLGEGVPLGGVQPGRLGGVAEDADALSGGSGVAAGAPGLDQADAVAGQ